ncbi:putative serine/threonine protein kinase ENV7 KNAG_0D00830 [Huiozyma naganishii CBS 8797]|uniref:non-specific serine/threonine protein kinase n=1 Tax=Huiozyma naganishii (strain ATCC MYA-139 / BCRC 22969 / CBS 8797 / KCTC 17520 / NBRC 10181 / NCYC 3082 / Yp74L-3) TaxID=1071383 RepID=J7R4R5_HUIN7|nr:hypothetical protein KNAG_0D00830 [Kazachstania naganishii CBS 8797]CCK69835.1 hypothetical protein KNAG_0D00830 [Kazachstania naganishii CBS 8797]
MESLIKSVWTNCCCCCWSFGNYADSLITINARKYQIVRLLSESELSLTYQVKSLTSGSIFGGMRRQSSMSTSNLNDIDGYDEPTDMVVRQIMCPFGDIESVSNALKEIDNYRYFKSPYIMQCLDSQVIQRRDGSKTVLILLPYLPLGSLRDAIDRNLLDGIRMSESEVIRVMIGTCRGLLYLHDPTSRGNLGSSMGPQNGMDAVSMTLSDDAAMLLDGTPFEMDMLSSHSMKMDSYAHMNIKPSNILFSSDGLPVITELGSLQKLDLKIENVKMLKSIKEWTEEHCTVYYMPPELLNLKVGTVLDCSVDIWSLGCTLYTLLFGISPFKREEQVNEVPLKYGISKARYSFPEGHVYSKKLVSVIETCLQVNPTMRPTVNELLGQLQDI